MPPTAVELKARLEKAVDQEGNVLDMEAALEIVTYLERITITKEALETTRIGRTINLMRKKTTNKELAKRAKKLIQKWSSNLQKILKSDSPLPIFHPNINGVSKQTEQSDIKDLHLNTQKTKLIENRNRKHLEKTTEQHQKNVKRKRTCDTSHLLKSNSVSPSSKSFTPSPNSHSLSPQTKFIKICDRIRPISPLTLALHTTNSNSTADHDLNNERLQCLPTSLISEDSLSPVKSTTILNKLENGHSSKENLSITKDDDTRCQEDRIRNNGLQHETNATELIVESSSIILKTDEFFNCETTSVCSKLTESFNPIPEEDLELKRKVLPNVLLSPGVEADGINGVYNSQNEWTSWTDSIATQGNNELLLLPYVILD